VFAPEDCWALRRGRPHLAEPGGLSPPCRHAAGPEGLTHFCLPLSAQSEALGVLTLRGESIPEGRKRTAQSLSDHIALALANLRLRETLRSQSIRDALTGLHNRRHMEESLERELRRAARAQYAVGVLMIDLDYFKHFNDTFGHAAGDTALKEVGLTLRAQIRGGDIACRYGGEEFVVILPEAGLEASRKRADDLRESVRHLNIRHEGQAMGAITLSVGVAVFPLHGASATDLLRAADAALYLAKQGGRDRVVVVEREAV
jgi:diguanylate cyclase (GGDEF)-like protein